MRVLVLVLVCLTAGCLALKPRPCKSPPLLTGSFGVSTASEKLNAFANYSYDALRQRIRLKEFGSYNNKTFGFDVLLLYSEHVMYRIHHETHTCIKKPLNVSFHPLAIPKDAFMLGEVVLGSSSGQGHGLLVNTWVGELQMNTGTVKYSSTVTKFGCVPVTTVFHTNKSGWVVTNFFNNVIGIEDPQQLIPPPFCKDAQLDESDEEDPVDFFSLF